MGILSSRLIDAARATALVLHFIVRTGGEAVPPTLLPCADIPTTKGRWSSLNTHGLSFWHRNISAITRWGSN